MENSVFDAGPFIHLHEITMLPVLEEFSLILTTPEVFEECKRIQDAIRTFVSLRPAKNTDIVTYLISQYDLQLGEATAIALCKQEQVNLFFTDDLDARETAKKLGLTVHGTIGILLRAFRDKKLSRKGVELAIENLYSNSSMFLTRRLKEWTLQQIDSYR